MLGTLSTPSVLDLLEELELPSFCTCIGEEFEEDVLDLFRVCLGVSGSLELDALEELEDLY